MNTLLKIAGAVVVLAAYAAGEPAAAGETVVRTARVEFTHAETLTEAGVRRLYRRLDQAAVRVCALRGAGDQHGRAFRTCRAAARDGAVREIDAPALTALLSAEPVVLARR